MRRYARSLILIAVLAIVAGLVLGFQTINFSNFQRGGDTPLGLSLGLDLQGGTHLVYQANLTNEETGEPIQPTEEQMRALRATIERRVNASGLGEPVIQLVGDQRLLVQLPGVKDTERAKSLIGETAQLEFMHRRLDVPRDLPEISQEGIVGITANTFNGALSTVEEETPPEEGEASPTPEGQATPEAEGTPQPEGTPEAEGTPQPQDNTPLAIVEFTPEAAERFTQVVNRLIQSILQQNQIQAPPSRLEVSVEGEQQLKYQLLGIQIRRVGESNKFAFPLPLQVGGDDQELTLEEARSALGDNPRIFFTEIQGHVDEPIGLTGEDLARAFPGQHQVSGEPIVNLEFTNEGARIFGELTQEIAGTSDQIAIFLDGEELVSPTVQSPITTGTSYIEGGQPPFTIQRVREISLLLESGRLPVPIELVQERNVDATLGADSLQRSVVAGLVGLGMVLLFMTMYYRLPGFMASVALLMYTAMLLSIFKLLPVTLTLAGVAAVILSIGMAVDANVLIFERMKDEIRAGRTLLSSMNIGFNRAWPAIRDSNVSTLITCAILYWFADQLGTTIVQGFAITLAIGVLISMFTAIVVTRTFLRVLAISPLAHRLGLFAPASDTELARQHSAAAAAQRS